MSSPNFTIFKFIISPKCNNSSHFMGLTHLLGELRVQLAVAGLRVTQKTLGTSEHFLPVI